MRRRPLQKHAPRAYQRQDGTALPLRGDRPTQLHLQHPHARHTLCGRAPQPAGHRTGAHRHRKDRTREPEHRIQPRPHEAAAHRGSHHHGRRHRHHRAVHCQLARRQRQLPGTGQRAYQPGGRHRRHVCRECAAERGHAVCAARRHPLPGGRGRQRPAHCAPAAAGTHPHGPRHRPHHPAGRERCDRHHEPDA